MQAAALKVFLVCVMLSFLTNFQYGYSTTYFNTPVASFKKYLNQSMEKKGVEFNEQTYNWMWNLLVNIWFVGSFVGMWLAPLLNDRYGRKAGFFVGNTLSLTASVLRTVAVITYLPELLFAGRIITSITVSMTYQSLILYLQECSPTKYRGMLSFTSEMSFALMCTLGMVLGTEQIFGHKLHFLLGVAIIPGVFAVLILIFLPETPKFLYIMRSDEKAAVQSIKFFQGEQADVQIIINNIKKESDEEDTNSSFKEILTTQHLKKAVIVSSFALLNTVAFWSLLLSSTYFLQQVHLHGNLAEWSSTAMTVLYTFGTIVGFFTVEKMSRRRLLLLFSTLCTLLLILYVTLALLNKLWHETKYGCLVCLLLYGFIYGMGVGPPSWILCTELVAQRHRSKVQSLCYSLNAIIVAITSFTILPLYDTIGYSAFLILYAAPSIASLSFLYHCLPETNGREIYAIVSDLKTSSD